MKTYTHFIVALAACFALVRSAPGMEPAGNNRAAGRTYAQGPLTAEDFNGKSPQPTPVNLGIEMVANTECQVRYEYRASIEQKGNRWTARLASFECTAFIIPEKCWITLPDSPRVLDHEQGHFDLAEISARRAQSHFDGLMRDSKTAVTGMDKRSVQRALEREIKKSMDEVYASHEKAQKTYDEETRHGTAPAAQHRHRQWQRAELTKLNAAKGDAAAKSLKPSSISDN
jgi:hypothetical protein